MSENQHEFLKKSLLNITLKQILVELENREVTGIQEKKENIAFLMLIKNFKLMEQICGVKLLL